MERSAAAILGIGLAALASACERTAPGPGAQPASVAGARSFLEEGEASLLRSWIEAERASWVQENFITPDTEAIAAEGSSFDAGYRTVLGLEGGFLAQNAMYGRGGQPCPACGEAIIKAYVAGLIGRPTHFCPACQPGPAVEPAPARRGRGPSGRSRGVRVE